jgi:antitoxin YefM
MAATISYSKLRENLKAACDAVCDRHEPLLVTRQKGGDVVLLSAEDWAGIEEVLHLVGSAENARRLFEAMSRPESEGVRFGSVQALKAHLGIDAGGSGGSGTLGEERSPSGAENPRSDRGDIARSGTRHRQAGGA